MKERKQKEKRINISNEIDISEATIETKILAEEAGFKQVEQHMISTAVSELARNIFRYAMKGEVSISIINRETKKGIEIVAKDKGPGIEDIEKAMDDDFSTSGGLGLGLPGVKRLMDEFMIDTGRQIGTKITIRKWLKKNA